MLRNKHVAALAFALVAFARCAWGQILWDVWVVVPTSECTGCGLPVDADPDCGAFASGCQRKDSLTNNSSSPRVVDSECIKCDYCPKCCTDPPCSCINLPPGKHCGTASVTMTNTIVFAMCPRLSAQSAAYVGTTMSVLAGWTPGTCTQNCDAVAGLCTITETFARLGGSANIVSVHHEFRRVGSWALVTGAEEGDGVCPIAGSPWIVPCGSCDSVVVVHVWGCPGTCIVWNEPCGPVCP